MKVKCVEDAVFLICGDDDEVIPEGKPTYVIPLHVFNKVSLFVNLFDSTIAEWLNRHDKPGTTYYWEENYHDKIVAFLVMMMPNVEARHISNSLCALGM